MNLVGQSKVAFTLTATRTCRIAPLAELTCLSVPTHVRPAKSVANIYIERSGDAFLPQIACANSADPRYFCRYADGVALRVRSGLIICASAEKEAKRGFIVWSIGGYERCV